MALVVLVAMILALYIVVGLATATGVGVVFSRDADWLPNWAIAEVAVVAGVIWPFTLVVGLLTLVIRATRQGH